MLVYLTENRKNENGEDSTGFELWIWNTLVSVRHRVQKSTCSFMEILSFDIIYLTGKGEGICFQE